MANKPFEITMQDVGYRRWDQLNARTKELSVTVLSVKAALPQGLVVLKVISFKWSKYRLIRWFQRQYICIRY